MITDNQRRALKNVLDSRHPSAGLVDRALLDELLGELERVQRLEDYVAEMLKQSEEANDTPAFSSQIVRELLGESR